MSEKEKLDLLLRIFGWDDTVQARYHALFILRGARREVMPTFEDFRVGRTRT